MAETWKAIPGFDKYEVSDTGRVRSHVPWRGYPTPRLLNPYDDGRGRYPRVRLCQSKKQSMQRVHVLVLNAFVGSCPEGMEARHLDGNYNNNNVGNLQWSSHSTNIKDQVVHGTHNKGRITHCPVGHEYTKDNIYVRPDGRKSRDCLKCRRGLK